MKKIFSVIIVLAMLASAFCITSFGAGTLVFSDNCDDGFLPRNWITDRESCHFEWDKYHGCIQGYEDARTLQSNFGTKYNKWWDQFYGKVDFQIRAFDDVNPSGNPHKVSIWYRDLFENEEGSQGAIYMFSVEVETGKATLHKSHTDFSYKDSAGVTQKGSVSAIIAEGQINGTIEVGEDAPFYELGIRVTAGKLECYFNQELCIVAEAKEDDEKLGHVAVNNVDSTVGSQRSPFVLFNGEKGAASWIAFDNFEIWTPDYDFVAVNYGDVNSDGDINLADVTKMLQAIAKWEITDYDAAAANVNGDDAVNLSDVTLVLRFIADWRNVTLGVAS